MAIETIEQIDKIFKDITGVINNYSRYNRYVDVAKNINLTDENSSYVFDKILSLIQINNQNYYNYQYFYPIFLNPTFKSEFVYKQPDLPWDYYKFDPNKFDKNFIISKLDKIWNFHNIFEKKILTFEEIKNNLHHGTFAAQCGFYITSLMSYEDFNMNILHNDIVRGNIPYNVWNQICVNSDFDFVFVHQYPSCNWVWSKLSLRGDMTIGEANKILSGLNHKISQTQNDYDEKYYQNLNAKGLMGFFDNLMLQPWMNSWFIKTHIKDENDKRFYLRKLNRTCYEGRSKKRNELLWRELLDKAMSPERLFYWYLDNYELDNMFIGLLPDDHPRAKPEYQIRPGIYPSGLMKF